MQNNVEVENIKMGIMHSLEKRGVLENMKAYLRSDLYNKLKKSELDADVKTDIKANKTTVMKDYDYDKIKLNRLTISLIADFLKKNGLNYSSSVFLPECKSLISDHPYSETEISQICEIDYACLNKSNEVCFLNHFIKNRIVSFKSKDCSDTQTQTDNKDNFSPSSMSLDDRLKEIDNKYSHCLNLEALMPAKSLEEKMIKYQREQESRFNADLEREIQRVRDVELSMMRIEENKKYLKKIDDIREEYEKEYREKFESLKKRESDVSMRISYKEKDLETQLYENRQKFLNELQIVKQKEDEMKRKYENDANSLKLEEEKLKFKQQELDYAKESSLKKYKEEVEQFKLEFERKFEIEKNELRKKKLEVEEKEFKNSLFIEKLTQFENDHTFLKEEKESLANEMRKLEKNLSLLSKDNEMLREELKIVSGSEKRSSDLLSRKDVEAQHLKEENKLLRESLDEHKKLSEERRKDQNVLLENLRRQLDENLDRMEKTKDYFETENERLKKYYLSSIEKEKEIMEEKVKELEKKNKHLEEQLNKYKDLYNQMSKRGNETNINNVNPNSSANFRREPVNAVRMNNYFNNYNDIKATDRMTNWSKLEKEADDLKNELKRSFAVSSRRDERQTKQVNMDQVYLEMYERLNNDKVNWMKTQMLTEQMKQIPVPVQNNFRNEEKVNTNINLEQLYANATKNVDLQKEIAQNNNINDKLKTILSVSENEEAITITNTNVNANTNNVNAITNQNLTNLNKDNLVSKISKDNERVKEEIVNKLIISVESVSKSDSAPHTYTQNNQNNQNTQNNQISQNNALTPPKEDMIKAKESLENELNKMKEEYNKKLESEKLPTPMIIGGDGISLKSKEFDNYSNNDFSVANLTSSNEWDLETNRKDNKLNTNGFYNTVQSSHVADLKTKEDLIINKEPILANNLNSVNPSSSLNNVTIQSSKNKLLNNSIKEESEESRNISNLIDNVMLSKDKNNSESANDYTKSYNKFSNVNYDIEKNDIEEDIKIDGESENYDYDFVEDVDGLEKKMSVDLDAIKNVSFNFNNSLNNKNMASNNNASKSVLKSQSIDKQIERLLQSKTSVNIEENISEDICIDNSKREKENKSCMNSNKSNTIEEDSALKYNDYYQSANMNLVASSSNNLLKNVLKDTSARDKDSLKLYESRTSDIKEEIIPDEEEDGFEPVNYDF